MKAHNRRENSEHDFAQSLVCGWAISADELSGGNGLFAFGLDLQQFERCSTAAAYKQLVLVPTQFSRRKGRDARRRRSRAYDLQSFSAKLRSRAGPGLKPAQPVVNLRCRPAEINAAVFFR
jgi:hypothetical protein